MLIEDYELEIFTPPCDPGTERFASRAKLTVDISDLLPYLNATLQGARYFPEAKALTWKKGRHNIAFHAFEITTGNVEDRNLAEKESKELIRFINEIWERRSEITPSYTTQPRPTPMGIYKLLPHKNCRECGEPTCYSFALKLVVSQRKLSECPVLTNEKYAENLSTLEEFLTETPSIA